MDELVSNLKMDIYGVLLRQTSCKGLEAERALNAIMRLIDAEWKRKIAPYELGSGESYHPGDDA